VDFTRQLLRGEHPNLLIEADATDPTAIGNAAAAVIALSGSVIQRDFQGAAPVLSTTTPAPYGVVLHKLYNPEGITSYNIIPGLMGIILTMTLVMMTAVAITRERERGTMENLLAMPVKPFEVISGKLVPYIFIGLIQSTIIMVAARFLFHIPFLGNVTVLFTMILLFIAGNLTLGITLSSFANNQMQAMQMTMFTIMPSFLLSGFLFPFKGMPVRGIMLKGSGWAELWPNIWPLLLFNAVVLTVGIKFYRKTLD
jgi:ABC-2 type transport system permease protein